MRPLIVAAAAACLAVAAPGARAQLGMPIDPTRNAVKVTDGQGAPIASDQAGRLRITDEPHAIFNDGFGATIDTNVWTAATQASGVAPALAGGVVTLAPGVAANGASWLTGVPSMPITYPGSLVAIWRARGIGLANNAPERFWGLANPQTGLLRAYQPMLDGVGFEIFADGHLYAAAYAANARQAQADLTALGVAPTDGAWHTYEVDYRSDATRWFIDNQLVWTSSASWTPPTVQTLQPFAIDINATSAPPGQFFQTFTLGATGAGVVNGDLLVDLADTCAQPPMFIAAASSGAVTSLRPSAYGNCQTVSGGAVALTDVTSAGTGVTVTLGGWTADQLLIQRAAVADTAKAGQVICDGTYRFRCAHVNASGQMLTAGAGAAGPYVATSTGYQQVASFSTATGFTPPSGSTYCYVVPNAAVNWRADGPSPTATVGNPLGANAQLLLATTNLSQFLAIPISGTATMNVDCYH